MIAKLFVTFTTKIMMMIVLITVPAFESCGRSGFFAEANRETIGCAAKTC